MRRAIIPVIAIGIAGALLTAPAASAAPITALPEGDQIVLIDCENTPGQAFTMGADGAATPIGTGTVLLNDANCSPSGAVDPTTGIAYYIAWGDTNDLATLDLETGVSTTVATLSGDHDNSCGIAIDASGDAFNADNNFLYSLNLATGVNTRIGDTLFQQTCSWGINPVDDQIYWFTRTGPSGSDVYRINKDNGEATFVVSLDVSALNGYRPDGVVFDKTGIAWIQDDFGDGPDGWYGVEPADLTEGIVYAPTGYFNDVTETVYSDTFDATGYFYSMGMIYVAGEAAAAPVLAATGASDVAPAGGLLAGGALLLGAMMLVVMRRRLATR
ncbi:MAG: hypothetical protein LH471_00745 [Salinibacterium sp.]|nr:hypothetical protein [Salinibacterium sp.]